MAIDSFSTPVLNRVVQDLRTSPKFLLDSHFPTQQLEDGEEIHYDVEAKKFRLSPFVSPLVEGQIVESLGVTTNVLKPPYIKDKRAWNPSRAFRRRIGESIGGSMSAEERQNAAIRAEMEDQISMLSNRMEWMAAKVLMQGAVTIQGDKYPLVVINFGRPAGHTITLTGATKWDQAGVNPLNDLRTWSETVFGASGSMPTKVTMDPLAWTAFSNNVEVKSHLDLYRNAATMLPGLAADKPIETGGVFMGRVQYFDIWVYSGTYHDDLGVAQKYLPNGAVLLVGDVEGVRAHGAIKDVQMLRAVPFFAKSWETPDPSMRWIMMQSAPLVFGYRMAASLSAIVV